MKLPKEIYGQNKIRDFYICKEYINGKTGEQIAESLAIKKSRVHQILRANSVIIDKHIGWSKSKRIHMLQRLAEKYGLHLSPSKDTLNILEQLRKEIEGDKPLVENHTHLNNIEVKISDETNIPFTQQSRQDIQSEERLQI